MAMQVAQELEKTGFIGTMTSVDVTDLAKMELWYKNRFRILLGDDTNLSKKLSDLHTVIYHQLGENTTGVLDIRDGKVKHDQFS